MFGRESRVEEVFSAAWEQVSAGRSIESVLADYPEHARELEPMLKLMKSVQAVPRPTLSPEALTRIQRRTQQIVQSMPSSAAKGPQSRVQSQISRPWTLDLRPWALGLSSKLVAGALLVIVVGGIALVALLASQQGTKAPPLVSYSGVITQIEAGEWQVGDEEVVIDSQTQIHGQPAVGLKMTCIAEALPGHDRMHALEVWVGMEPDKPITVPTLAPPGQSFTQSVLSTRLV
jgi:hypothetical protein